jgi:hypothetical protein
MNRHIELAVFICLLLGALPADGNSQEAFLDYDWPAVCVDSLTWVDIRVDSMVDSIHSYACVMYIDTTVVHLDSVIQGTILDSVIGDYDTLMFEWEHDDHFPDSLYLGATIFGVSAFVNGPGQLARIWLTGKSEGETPVAFGQCVIRDPVPFSDPMEVTTQDGRIYVLGPGIQYGDVNNNGIIDVGDVVYLVNYLYRNGPNPLPWWFAGDASCDKTVDVGDVVFLVNYLYRFGPAPCYPCGAGP